MWSISMVKYCPPWIFYSLLFSPLSHLPLNLNLSISRAGALLDPFCEIPTRMVCYKEDNMSGQGEESVFIHSGGEEHRRGVGIMLNKKTAKCLLGYRPISERAIMCKIQARPFNIVILQCYAPTADQSQEKIDEFYMEIETGLKQNKSDDIVIILGDFNAKVGCTRLCRRLWFTRNKRKG